MDGTVEEGVRNAYMPCVVDSAFSNLKTLGHAGQLKFTDFSSDSHSFLWLILQLSHAFLKSFFEEPGQGTAFSCEMCK